MDDVLVFGCTQQEYDAQLCATLQKIQSAGATLNKEKCEFSRDRLTFLGHVIDRDGVSPDPQKTLAIVAIKYPHRVEEIPGYGDVLPPKLLKFHSRCVSYSAPRGPGYGGLLKMKHSRG